MQVHVLHWVQFYKECDWASFGHGKWADGDRREETEGLREKKRRETLKRIAETGLRLFLANGYEATTLDAIAEAAGVSRRTIFYYFKSKEEILLAYQSGIGEMIRAAVLQESTDQAPLDAVLNALIKLNSRPDSEHMIIIDLAAALDGTTASEQAGQVHAAGASGFRSAMPVMASGQKAERFAHRGDGFDWRSTSRYRRLG